MSIVDRTWEQATNGWASRPATPAEMKKQHIFDRWARREIDYKQVLKELKEQDL